MCVTHSDHRKLLFIEPDQPQQLQRRYIYLVMNTCAQRTHSGRYSRSYMIPINLLQISRRSSSGERRTHNFFPEKIKNKKTSNVRRILIRLSRGGSAESGCCTCVPTFLQLSTYLTKYIVTPLVWRVWCYCCKRSALY